MSEKGLTDELIASCGVSTPVRVVAAMLEREGGEEGEGEGGRCTHRQLGLTLNPNPQLHKALRNCRILGVTQCTKITKYQRIPCIFYPFVKETQTLYFIPYRVMNSYPVCISYPFVKGMNSCPVSWKHIFLDTG